MTALWILAFLGTFFIGMTAALIISVYLINMWHAEVTMYGRRSGRVTIKDAKDLHYNQTTAKS